MQNLYQRHGREAFAILLCSFVLLSSCAEERLQPDDVEYRKDDNGTRILFAIEADEPFGESKQAFVEQYYPDCSCRSADPRQYGNGATEVWIGEAAFRN